MTSKLALNPVPQTEPYTHSVWLCRGLFVAMLLGFLSVLSACGTGTANHVASGTCRDFAGFAHGPGFTMSCYLTFAPTVSYHQALRTVTDFGLLPTLICSSQVGITVNGHQVDAAVQWQPVGQIALYEQYHSLIVYPGIIESTANPQYWLTQVQHTSTISSLRDAWAKEDVSSDSDAISPTLRIFVNHDTTGAEYINYTCPPPILPAAVTPTTPVLLPNSELGSYARIGFSSAISYDSALATITNLGLGLDNPCARTVTPDPSATAIPAEYQGQEASFAKAHTLVISLTGAASTLWRQQTLAATGVVGVTPLVGVTPESSSCP